MYQIQRFGAVPFDQIAIVTMLMVHADHRKGRLMMKLYQHAHQHAMGQRFQMAFLDCNDHLVRMNEKFGFRPYMGTVEHPRYGRVTPMALDLLDVAHLRRMRSPFARQAERFLRQNDQMRRAS